MHPLADLGMLQLDEEAAFAQMRIFGEVLVAHCGKRRQARGLQNAGDIPAVAFLRPRRNYLVERVFILFAQRHRLETRVIREFGFAHRTAQGAPFIFAADRDRNPFVVVARRLVALMRRHQRVAIAVAHGLAPVHLVFEQALGHQHERGLELRLVDVLALAGECAMRQRGHDRESAEDACVRVGIRDANLRRLAAAVAGRPEHAGCGARGGPVTDEAAKRPGLSVT